MQDPGWDDSHTVVMAGRAVVSAGVVTDPGSCWGGVGARGIERLVTAGTAKQLSSQTKLWTHL